MKKMNPFLRITMVIVAVTFFLSPSNGQGLGDIKPNIIIFYADDLGWQDTELNNLDEPSPWETPNISKLAEEGLNFTNGYSPAPTCSPSRCALLSGLHPAKTGITHVRGGGIPEARYSNYMAPFNYDGLLPEYFTIAEALKMNGYATGHVGKWHSGHLKMQSPTKQGFDFSFEGRGAHQGPKKGGSRLDKFATHNANDLYRLSDDKYPPFTKDAPNGISYPKDDVTENALQFIEDNKEEPFFLYLAHWMVHSPIHTKNRELLQYYSDKLGLDFPTKDIPVTTGGQTNPFFGSMVTTLDWSLGRVVNLLKTTDDPRNPGKKLYETTYIIFSSDNGAVERVGKEIVTDNAPLDQGKKYAQEGGIRVPLVIHGPNIPEGKNYDGLVNQLDFFPTILDLTNSEITAEQANNFDGLDISGVLLNNEKDIKDESGNIREDLWWHFPHNQDKQMQSAIRSGDYKLYKNHTKGNYELYRLYKNGKRADLEEQYNIIEKEPKVAKELIASLEKHLKDSDAQFPYKSPTKTKDAFEKEGVANIPVVVNEMFNESTTEATIQLEKGKSKVIEAYALISIGDAAKGKVTKKKGRSMYIKLPVQGSQNNTEFSFNVPKEALDYLFVVIDENRFIVKGAIHDLQ